MSKTLAETFRRLHQGPDVLVLANCWDAGSARLIESLGAKALATTSAGLAWANGYPDGDVLPLDVLAHAVGLIARTLNVPLSVDMEGGYGTDAHLVGAAVARIVEAGAVGINIEDGKAAPALLQAKITEAKKAARKNGVDVFINARTDVYLQGLVPESERVKETIRRAHLYREAGADGIFVPAVVDREAIRTIASEIKLPLNVLAWSNLPKLDELPALGVRRLSAGSSIAAKLWGAAAALGKGFMATGSVPDLSGAAMTYGDINTLVADR